jgi:hypothetical protein
MYFQAAMAISRRYGNGTPEDKQSPMGRYLVYLGIGIDLNRGRRILSSDKRLTYTADTEAVLASTAMANGCLACKAEPLGSLVHKLLHASEVIPLGRQHLFHCRESLKTIADNRLDEGMALVTKDGIRELHWWVFQLAKSEDLGLPLASRSSFPVCNDSDSIIEYHDASREIGNVPASGWGGWTVRPDTTQVDGSRRDTFFYVVGRWTDYEINTYSINVLESHVKNMSTFTFVEAFRQLGDTATHVTSFSDNTTAEANAEFGRPGTALLNLMLQGRQRRCNALGLHARNERVASIDNDIADLLSRGDIYEALQFPRSAGLAVQQLQVDEDLRRIPRLEV